MNRFWLVVLFAGISVSAWSQEIKLNIGLNLSDVTEEANFGTRARVSWHGGASITFGDKFYVEPGFIYVDKFTEFQTGVNEDINIDFRLKGIRIPVDLGIHLLGREKSAVSWRFFVGPSAFIVTSVNSEALQKEDIKTFNYGFYTGTGIDFLFFFIDAEYEWTLNDLSSGSSNLGESRSLFATLGVRFPL